MRAFLIAVTALLFTVTGCKGQPKSNKGGAIRQVKGDPNVFIKSASMNGTNSIPEHFFTGGEKMTLDIRGFAEEPPEQPKQDIEEGNEAPDPSSTEAEARLRAIEGRFAPISEGYTFKNSYFRVRFVKNPVSREVQLVSVEVDGQGGKGTRPYAVGKDIRVLHTDWNDDSFSILVQNEAAGDRFVYDLFFTKSGPIPFAKNTAENFYYLLGKGLKFQWRQDVPRMLILCGDPGAGATQAFERGVNAWRAHLNGRLNFQSITTTDCPPFSDLHTQVTVFVDDWIEIVGQQAVGAFTSGTFNFGKGEIVDSDIFFLREEWQEGVGGRFDLKRKDTDSRIIDAYAETLTHEMGHFLGLHHQFNDQVPSIMGYSDVSYITPYDHNAIQALYPLIATP